MLHLAIVHKCAARGVTHNFKLDTENGRALRQFICRCICAYKFIYINVCVCVCMRWQRLLHLNPFIDPVALTAQRCLYCE